MENSPQSNTSALFNTDFCLRLTSQILENEAPKGSNFVASPSSLHVMLSLIAAGSKGQTLQQLLHFLGSTSVGDLNLLSSKIISTVASPTENLEGGPLLSFVNGAWLDQRFILKPSFQEIAKDFYEAEIKNVDFEAKAKEVVEEVNLWARMATNGLIKQLFRDKSLDSETTLVLANALYFKGAWDQQFDPSMTQQRDFHLLNGQIVQAPFMTTKIFMRHLYGSFDGYKVLQIPYQSGQDARKFSMYFFLPSEQDGLPNLIQMVKLNSGFLNRQFKTNLESLPHLWIPKFKFSCEFEASETMKDMGLKLPFKPGEMTEMVDTGNGDDGIYVSDIFHKSYIEINEEGTEAAASTAVRFKTLRAIIPTPSFVADHPFLFMIREETHGMVLFLGAVFNPLLDT
ncbi:serpin-ZX-like [Ziziphus jujuba]|uniref:Serpin-ZX-like n=1 Tax=Ziziphus jujuba TaxID=326968 RepID=A0ABM4A7A2_ZIZJJ|nr:serpin-ZX-like [Ziziphus jujuba]